MADILTLVGRVAGDAGATALTQGAAGEIVLELDDKSVVIVAVASNIEVVRADGAFDWNVKVGDRVAIRATVVDAGNGPQPTSVKATRLGIGAGDGKASDNQLAALVDDDANVRSGAVAPTVDVPRPKAARVKVGRAPYYRIGAGFAIGGALLCGIAFASWGFTEMRTRPPVGWTAAALLFGLFGLVGASAISAGRAPFEVGKGRAGGSTGRPAWGISFALFMAGFFVVCAAAIPVIDGTTRGAPMVAAGLWLDAAAGAGFLIFIGWKLRKTYRFAFTLLFRASDAGTVRTGALERRVTYTHKSRGYTRQGENTATWIEGHASVKGDEQLTVRTRTSELVVDVKQLLWSAPIRFLPGGGTQELTSLATIATSDQVVVSLDRTHLFGAANGSFIVAFGGHVMRFAVLCALTIVCAYLAIRVGRFA